MTRFLNGLALSAWGAVAFAGTLWASFPSKAVADRLSFEVSERSGGAWDLRVDSVAPWWWGVSAQHVVISTVDKLVKDGVPTPLLLADSVGIRVSPWSLLRSPGSPLFIGFVGMDDSEIDVTARLAKGDSGLAMRSLKLDASNLPVVELLGLLGLAGEGGTTATGGVDVNVDLQVPNGLGKADGDISIKGNQILIEKVTSTLIGWNQMEVNTPIDELNIQMSVEDGDATLTEGVLSGPLVDATFTGEISFDDNVSRSKVDLAAVLKLGDWADTPLDSFRSLVEGALRSAKASDDSYHYKVEGQLGRLGFEDFRPDHETGGRSTLPRPTASTPVTTPTSLGGTSRPQPPATPPPNPNDGVAPEPEPEPELLDDPNAEIPEEGVLDDAPHDEELLAE